MNVAQPFGLAKGFSQIFLSNMAYFHSSWYQNALIVLKRGTENSYIASKRCP